MEDVHFIQDWTSFDGAGMGLDGTALPFYGTGLPFLIGLPFDGLPF